MVPAHTTVENQLIGNLIVEVEAHHLGSCQSLSSTAEASTATAGESHIVYIVSTHHTEGLKVFALRTAKGTVAVTVFRTSPEIHVEHLSVVHALLHTEVEHGFLFAIINTCHTRLVTLLIVCPHTFYNRGGQILHGCLGVTCHKLLTVDQYFFHLLAVDGDLT